MKIRRNRKCYFCVTVDSPLSPIVLQHLKNLLLEVISLIFFFLSDVDSILTLACFPFTEGQCMSSTHQGLL